MSSFYFCYFSGANICGNAPTPANPNFFQMHCYFWVNINESFIPLNSLLCAAVFAGVQSFLCRCREAKSQAISSSVCRTNLPSRLTPLSAGPPLQSYKYGRIKVKIFSISVLHRRRKCHPCCIWDLEKLGNEPCVRSAGRGCVCVRAQMSVFLRAHTICCPPTNGKIIFAANSPQVITTSQTQYWIIPISL